MQKSFQLLARLNLILILDLIGNIDITKNMLRLQCYNDKCELNQIINPLIQHCFIKGIGEGDDMLKKAGGFTDNDGTIYDVYHIMIDDVVLDITYVINKPKE